MQMPQVQQHLSKPRNMQLVFLQTFWRASLSLSPALHSQISLGCVGAASLTPGAAKAMGSPLKRGLMWQLGADKPLISSPFWAGGDCQPGDTIARQG